MFDIFFVENYFFHIFSGGLAPLHHPPGAPPPGPGYFKVEDSHGNRFALNGISAKDLNIFFFLRVKTFFFKSSESFPKNISSK